MINTEELIPRQGDKIVCVKVGKVRRENLYEMTRKYWVMRLDKASLATHVLAVEKSIVIAVYIPQRWYSSEVPGMEGRLEFDGVEESDSEYLGKSVKSYYGKSLNPITYINYEKKDLKPLIQAYIKQKDYIRGLEEYKWNAVQFFQHIFTSSSLPLTERMLLALSKHQNLLDTQNYFPLGVLRDVYSQKGERVNKLFEELFEQSVPLGDRVRYFITKFDGLVSEMANEGYSDWKGRTNLQSYQDPHAISVYLSMRYPDDNYIYKYSVFKDFGDITGFVNTSAEKVDRMQEFYSMCDEVKKQLVKEREFIAEYKDWMKQKGYSDDNFNILTQDFIYAVVRHLNANRFTSSGKNESLTLSEPQQIEASILYLEGKGGVKLRKGVNYTKRDELFRGLGLLGEEWVIRYEKMRLSKLGISHEVIHTSIEVGDGMGYDIESVEDDGITPRYIEVKTTTGSISQPFYYTDNELCFSEQNKEHFYVYRVYDFQEAGKKADLMIIHGSMKDLNGKPTTYKAVVNKTED